MRPCEVQSDDETKKVPHQKQCGGRLMTASRWRCRQRSRRAWHRDVDEELRNQRRIVDPDYFAGDPQIQNGAGIL